jgi:hypothetical protein
VCGARVRVPYAVHALASLCHRVAEDKDESHDPAPVRSCAIAPPLCYSTTNPQPVSPGTHLCAAAAACPSPPPPPPPHTLGHTVHRLH